MQDKTILEHINDLVDEEKRLRDLMERHTGRTVAALTGGEIGGGNRQARRSGGSHGPGSSHQRR